MNRFLPAAHVIAIHLLLTLVVILSACSSNPSMHQAATATQPREPSSTPAPQASPPPALTATPATRSQTWEFDSTCGTAPVVDLYQIKSGLWSFKARQEGKANPIWDFTQEKIADRFQWHAVQPFTRMRQQNKIAFTGTDQDQKSWIGVIRWDCRGKVSLEILLPIEHPQEAFLGVYWLPNSTVREYWLIDGKKLSFFPVPNPEEQVGQAAWSTIDVPFTAMSASYGLINPDFNHDGKPERMISWWEWSGDLGRNRPEIKLIQFYSETSEGYRKIGEVDPTWPGVDLNGDRTPEYLKPVPPGSTEKWEIYRYQGEAFGWDGEISIPAPTPAVPVTVDPLPPLPNDLYFTQDNQGWVWPKEGGKLLKSRVLLPTAQKSPCVGKKAGKEARWSPDCRYAIIPKPGKIEGSTSAVIDQKTGKEIEIPDSFVYAKGFSSFAWDPKASI